MSEETSNLYQEMIQIVNDELDALDQVLVEAQSQLKNEKLISSIFKHVQHIHSTINFYEFENLDQLIENAQKLIQTIIDSDGVGLSPAIVTSLFAVIDAIRDVLLTIESTGKEGDFVYKEVGEKLDTLAQAITAGDHSVYNPPLRDSTDPPEEVMVTHSSQAQQTEEIASTDDAGVPADTDPTQSHQPSDDGESIAIKDNNNDDAHHSELTASSEQLVQSTADTSEDITGDSAQIPIEHLPTQQGLTILWAEPNVWISQLLREVLTENDRLIDISPASLAIETALKVRNFDVVIVDPTLLSSSFETLQQIIERYSDCQWLLFSKEITLFSGIASLPAVHVISKPGVIIDDIPIDQQQSIMMLRQHIEDKTR